MNISELEEKVLAAKGKVKAVMEARGNSSERLAAFESLEVAQRELAAAKGEPYAVPYDIGFKPEAAVSEPVLLQTDYRTFLTFSAKRLLSDGKYHDAGYGIIEFERCSLTKFGYPNDEALAGHPLYDKGLGAYRVFRVCNSSWIKQMTEQNRVSFPKTPDSNKSHFIFTFHDSTFECIANGLTAALSNEPYEKIFAEITKKAFKLV
jgi:hypothetical protein